MWESTGAHAGMWLPSIAPAHWGIFHFLSNPVMVSSSGFLQGNAMNFGSKCSTIAWDIECTITHTVDLATPNECPIVRYSTSVAKVQRVIATLSYTDNCDCRRVCCLWMKPFRWSQRLVKEIFTHSEVLQPFMWHEERDHMVPPMSNLSLVHCLTWLWNSSWVDKLDHDYPLNRLLSPECHKPSSTSTNHRT